MTVFCRLVKDAFHFSVHTERDMNYADRVTPLVREVKETYTLWLEFPI